MLRSPLGKNGYRLTGSSNLGQYVSMALKQEIEQIKQELEMPGQVGLTRDISVIFEGSTRQGEAIVIIVRFMDNDWNITQRLVRIKVCSKSVNANQLAQVLNQCLSVEYGVRANSLLVAMRDGASVNQAALNIVSFIFSHTLDNVGNHLNGGRRLVLNRQLHGSRGSSTLTCMIYWWRSRLPDYSALLASSGSGQQMHP